MHARRGFTLLELALIILLMAFILGAIFIGQSLIRNAELRSVIGEVARYTQAVHDFRDKYRSLPGDYPNATNVWGAANGDFVTCMSSLGIGIQTCDGNGDGRITSQAEITTVSQYEQFRAWQHLVNAAMIEGNFVGIAGGLHPQDAEIGINVPASKLTGAGYQLFSMYANELAGDEHYFPLDYMHVLQLGADIGPEAPSSLIGPILTTQEAFAFDSKQDDGLPGSGKVIAPKQTSPYAPDCTNNDLPRVARYDIEQEDYKCSLIFVLGF